MKSWLKVSSKSDFSIYNLPFGIFSTNKKNKRIGVAIGDHVIDLHACNSLDLFKDLNIESNVCLLYTSPSPRDPKTSRMPSSA